MSAESVASFEPAPQEAISRFITTVDAYNRCDNPEGSNGGLNATMTNPLTGEAPAFVYTQLPPTETQDTLPPNFHVRTWNTPEKWIPTRLAENNGDPVIKAAADFQRHQYLLSGEHPGKQIWHTSYLVMQHSPDWHGDTAYDIRKRVLCNRDMEIPTGPEPHYDENDEYTQLSAPVPAHELEEVIACLTDQTVGRVMRDVTDSPPFPAG